MSPELAHRVRPYTMFKVLGVDLTLVARTSFRVSVAAYTEFEEHAQPRQ